MVGFATRARAVARDVRCVERRGVSCGKRVGRFERGGEVRRMVGMVGVGSWSFAGWAVGGGDRSGGRRRRRSRSSEGSCCCCAESDWLVDRAEVLVLGRRRVAVADFGSGGVAEAMAEVRRWRLAALRRCFLSSWQSADVSGRISRIPQPENQRCRTSWTAILSFAAGSSLVEPFPFNRAVVRVP